MKCRFNLTTLHCLESQLLATQTCVQLRDALTSIAEHQLNPHRLYRLRLNIARYFLVRRTTIAVGSGCSKKKRSFSTRVADTRHCVLLSGYQATNNAVFSLRRNSTSGPWAANLPCALKGTGSNICADTGHSVIMVLLSPSRRASQ